MSDTRTNITLPANTWVNLYGVSKVHIGHVLAVQNVGSTDIYLSSQQLKPDLDADNFCIIRRGDWMRNEPDDTGAWAYCQSAGGALSIRVI